MRNGCLRGQFKRTIEVFQRFAGTCAIGHLAKHFAHLVDDLGVVHTKSGMRLGMIGLQFESVLQAALNFPAQTLAQSLDDRNTLAIAAQVECVKIMAVRIVR